MYEKFDYFNLCLNTFSTAQANANIGLTINDNNVIMSLSGLPWINQTYNPAYLSNTSSTVISVFEFAPGDTKTDHYNSKNVATFGKIKNW